MTPPKDHIPGTSPACIEEREEREALTAQIQELRAEIGEAPDPTAPVSQRDGTGIKGTLSRILGGLARVESKVDDLGAKARSVPPPAPPSRELVRKIGWVLLLVVLAVGEARTLYSEIKGAKASPAPALTTGKP